MSGAVHEVIAPPSGSAPRSGLEVRPADDRHERDALARAAEVAGGLSLTALGDNEGLGGIDAVVQARQGNGVPIDNGVRRRLERKLRHSFSDVRIHADAESGRLADSLGARAFTVRRDIFFARDQFRPETRPGLRLLAHELTHVTQQAPGGEVGPAIQRDLAIEPPNPAAVAPALTVAEIAEAIRFNTFRFKDPYTIRVIRDVLGLEPVPAVVDEDFARAVAEWQAQNNMPADGKVGAATTHTLVGELTAEGDASDAEQLRRDNFVSTTDVTPQTFNVDAGHPPQHFVWEVGFQTSLRNGFIIQQVDNDLVATMCGGGAYTGWRPTPRYWEAWRVDGAGRITPNVGAIHDMWTRPFVSGSRGRWSMRGRFFTVLRLPPGFVAGAVADAGILQSTAAAPSSDALGLEVGFRRVGGEWNFCPLTDTHVRR